MGSLTYTHLSYDDLNGWVDDDHRAALDVYCTTCADPDFADTAATTPVARGFIEAHFTPVLIADGAPMTFTGYYEPELSASRTPDDVYHYPLYALPDDFESLQPYHSRRAIEEDQVLAGRGLEIAYLADPIDVFFLQVQGSGRLQLTDGTVMRVGYAAKNGLPYTSIGKALIARGIFTAETVSPDAIRAWVPENGALGRALLWENESFVFFTELTDIPVDHGPIGAMGKPVTAGRTIAVDQDVTPLGLPVWIEKTGVQPMNRLMVAQDIGSAIKGAQRADVFCGTGDAAGRQAGQMKDGGRMVVLMPNADAVGLG